MSLNAARSGCRSQPLDLGGLQGTCRSGRPLLLLRDRGACHDTVFYCGRGFKSLTSLTLRFVEKLWQLSVVTFWCRLQPEVLLPQVRLLQPQRRMFVTLCFEAVQKFSKRK